MLHVLSNVKCHLCVHKWFKRTSNTVNCISTKPSKAQLANKGPMAAKIKPDKSQTPHVEEVDGLGSQRKDMSNMLTQLKPSNDTNKKELLAKYQALGRFDPEKANLRRKWKLGKSCRWVANYYQEISQEKTTKRKELEGYGTRSPIS